MKQFELMEGDWKDLCPFQITSIVDDRRGLVVRLEDNVEGVRKGELSFGSHYAYRNFNEADLHSYWSSVGGVLESGLYNAADSEFLEWAARQSVYGELDASIRHYMIVSVDDVLEVLSFDQPEFAVTG